MICSNRFELRCTPFNVLETLKEAGGWWRSGLGFYRVLARICSELQGGSEGVP